VNVAISRFDIKASTNEEGLFFSILQAKIFGNFGSTLIPRIARENCIVKK